MAKYGLINTQGKEVLPFVFDQLDSPTHGLILFKRKEGDQFGYMNLQQHKLVEQRFDLAESFDEVSALARVRTRGKGRDQCGLINVTGEFVLPCKHDGLGQLRCGLIRCAVQKGGRKFYGFKDVHNNWVIEPVFLSATDFSCGLAVVTNEKGERIVINAHGKKKCGPFTSIGEFHDGVARVWDDRRERVFFIDGNGDRVLEPPRELDVRDFYAGRCMASNAHNHKCGFIDIRGVWVIEPKYDEASAFYDYAYAVVEVNKREGLVDLTGREVVRPQYASIRPPHCGLAMFEKVDPANGKVGAGYVDLFGHVVIEPQYTSAYHFSEGFAVVKK